MRFKNLLCFLFLFCSISLFGAKSNKVSVSDYDKSLRLESQIINPDKLLSVNEEAELKAKLDSINAKFEVNLAFFLFENVKFSLCNRSEEFATKIYESWFEKYYEEKMIVVVYNLKTNDFGYYCRNKGINKGLSSELTHVMVNLSIQKEVLKQNLYPVFSNLLDSIESRLQITKEKETEKQVAQQVAINKTKEQLETKDKIFAIISTIITLILTVLWLLFLGSEFQIEFSPGRYLLGMVVLHGLFFLFIYSFILSLFEVLVFSGEEREFLVYTKKVMPSFMLLGGPLTLVILGGERFVTLIRNRIRNRNMVNQAILPSRFSEEYQGEYQAIDQSTRVLHHTGNSALLNINRATFEQIINMPGRLHFRDAERIIQARRNSGLFEDIEDLQRRSRLSEQSINDLRPRIYFFEGNDNRIFPQTTRSSFSTPANKVKNAENQVDINTATSEQIRELSVLLTIMDARRIVQERDTNGDFKNIKDLRRRSNLADALIKDIEKKISFSDPKDESSDKGKREGKRIVDL